MKRRLLFICQIIALLWCFPLSLVQAETREVPFISVMADSSLAVPFTKLAQLYSSIYGITVNITYDSSLELASQLDRGEHTDVFVSASPFATLMLKRKELVDIRTLTTIAQNKLALIASVDNPLARKIDADATTWKQVSTASSRVMLVIGDPDTTPLGAYTREMLQSLELWEKIKPMSIRADNSGMALYLIAQGKTAGITYYSDAATSRGVKILAVLPQKFYSPIVYKAMALEGKEKPFATQFIAFLSSIRAKEVLKESGFEVQ